MEMGEVTKEEKLERTGIRTLEKASICGLEKESRGETVEAKRGVFQFSG